MAGLLNKLMDFIGIEDAEMDDVYEDDYFADDEDDGDQPPAFGAIDPVG